MIAKQDRQGVRTAPDLERKYNLGQLIKRVMRLEECLDGLDGSSAVSPTVTISTITGGHRVTITDAGGTKSFDVMDGEDGSSGANGVSVTHEWSGTTLKVTSASGTTSADLKGDKGDKGDKGAQGIQGVQGAKGEKGDAGAQGPQGEKGEKGDPGAQGPQGDKGDKGDPGDTGAKGDKGDTGATGAQGEKGDTGEKGDPGEKGDRGTGILKITAAPSSYTTAIGSYTPKYRIATATVISQSGVSEVKVGDILQYSYYQYAVDHLDSTYAYISKTRTSIRGATGAAGAAGADGADGKSAYAYAQDGGYTGTEAEFAARMAQAVPEVVQTTGDSETAVMSQKAVTELTKGFVKSFNGILPDENGDVVVTAKAEQPNFVDSVEEMTDTTKAYVLKSTGEIWTYQSYQTEATQTPNFTNLFDKSKVLVNKAYLAVNAAAADKDGHYLTGAYAYDFSSYDTANPSTVRIKGGVDVKNTYSRLVYYRYAVPTDLTVDTIRAYQQFNAHVGYTTESDGTISFPLVIKKDGTTVHSEYKLFDAFAFSFYKSSSAITIDDVPDLIITIDEEITYTEVPPQTVYEWRSTGMSYNGADYEPRIIALEEDVADLKTRVDSLESGGVSATVTEDAEETIYPDFACENDFTIVGDEIWGSKNESTYTRIVRHKIVNGVLTKLSEIKLSDVVHLNTLDYCPENDCLITGNGANDQNTEGNCFWIIPNASNLPNLTGTLSLADIAIQYDVDIGYKVQAIWGDGNLGQHNLVYLLSNDDEVRRAIIHKNEDGSFANTYTIVGDVFTITGASGYQGADYYGGYLYFGFGGTNFVLAKVNTKDFTAVVTEYPYCTADGTAIKGVFQGVAVDKDHLWLYPNGITAGNYLVKYTR